MHTRPKLLHIDAFPAIFEKGSVYFLLQENFAIWTILNSRE